MTIAQSITKTFRLQVPVVLGQPRLIMRHEFFLNWEEISSELSGGYGVVAEGCLMGIRVVCGGADETRVGIRDTNER